MKRSLPILITLLISMTGYGQVISSFNWEANPVTQAASGPNAISVSTSATSCSGGANGNGLNPGSPKMDIDLVLPGSPYFDVPGIDISVSFRREESEASFFRRSSKFDFGMSGTAIYAKFTIDNGSGGSTLINSGSVYNVPNDHAFHVYRFTYNSGTGKASIAVDGTVVYNYVGTAGRSLAWNNSGNVVIGAAADATGNNVAIFDNMMVSNVPVVAVLPVTLTSFNAQPENNKVALNWTTTKEEHFSHFVLERSVDGVNYSPIATVFANGSEIAATAYSFTDKTPLAPVGYYRLKLVDANGNYEYSMVRTASFGKTSSSATLSAFPNPAKDVLNVKVSNVSGSQYRYSVVALNGKVQDTKVVTLAAGQQQFAVSLPSAMMAGVYMLEVENVAAQSKQAFKFVKL